MLTRRGLFGLFGGALLVEKSRAVGPSVTVIDTQDVIGVAGEELFEKTVVYWHGKSPYVFYRAAPYGTSHPTNMRTK